MASDGRLEHEDASIAAGHGVPARVALGATSLLIKPFTLAFAFL
jgi:hypothetical protein